MSDAGGGGDAGARATAGSTRGGGAIAVLESERFPNIA